MPLYTHQQKTVDFCHEHPRIHDWSDCGTGKTRAHLEAFRAAPLAGRALVLAPLSILESAWLDDLRRFTPTLRANIAYARNREAAFKAESDLVITNHDATTWIAAQAKRDKRFLAEFTHLICDECFPSGTPIATPLGPRPIETLKLGDIVDTSHGALPITRVFHKTTTNLIEVRLHDGTTFRCTSEHPLATDFGWLPAAKTRGRTLVRTTDLQTLQHKILAGRLIPPLPSTRTVLQQNLQANMELGKQPQHSGRREESWRRTQGTPKLEQGQKSDPRTTTSPERASQPRTTKTSATRQWTRADQTRTAATNRTAANIHMEPSNQNPHAERERISHLLQSGFWLRVLQDRDRSGRQQSQHAHRQNTGLEKNSLPAGARVARITHIQLDSPTNVWNLEVEGPHDYIANGVLVHNCTAYKNLAGRGNAARARALADIRHHFEQRRLLTGTPASGSVLDLWALGYLCDDGKRLGTSFFAYRNSVTTPIQVGPSTNMIQWKEKPGAIDIVTKQLADITIRHRREDCIDIPPNHKYMLYTSLDSTSRQLYDEMHRDSLLALDSGAVVDAIHAGARAVKLLQICTGAVYDGEHIAHLIHQDRYRMVIDLVQERPWPCLVLFNWRHEADQLAALATAAKLPHGIMNGDTSVDDRIALVRAFQAGELRLLIAHPGTVAHGLTLTTGRTTIWSSPTYRAEYFLQANARIDRNGQQHPTETIMIAARDTREELVYDMLQGKVDRVSSLLHLMTNLQT